MIYVLRNFAFGLVITLSLILVFPFCLVRPFSRRNNRYFVLFAHKLAYLFMGLKLHTEGSEILKEHRPSILVSNHQHNYDILVGGQYFSKYMAVLGKSQLGFIPVFGQAFVLCGNILIKRGHKTKAIKTMRKIMTMVVKRKLTILIFAEGTRNQKEELLPFKKGAFVTAIDTQIPIIPCSVSQYYLQGDLKNKLSFDIYTKIHEPISTIGMTEKDIPDLMNKTRMIIQAEIKMRNQNYN